MIGRTLLCIAAACAATSAAAGKIRGDSLDELQKLAGDSEPAAAPTAADAPEAGPVDWPPKGVGMKPKTPGQFVPFGKAIPRQAGVTYYTATGEQECMVCKYLIANAKTVGPQFYELANGAYPEQIDMMHAQQKTLQACPEFANDWCYQDLGGSQQLRAPCPDHLKCHYCLGLNPLHCL